MRLIMIRHGQPPANVAYTMHTALPGPELPHLGQQQAAALLTALADEKIDALYACDRQRTALTAVPLAADRGRRVLVSDVYPSAAGNWPTRPSHDALARRREWPGGAETVRRRRRRGCTKRR
jgi:probable phosphoglycerate mutase